jgi:ferritin
MDMETLILNNLNTYNEVINSYDDIKEIFDESSDNIITVFVSSFEDKVIIDTATLNTIMVLLEKIYANNLALLFFISCLSSLYVCTYTRRKKDFVILNNVEPKILKGEIIEKV